MKKILVVEDAKLLHKMYDMIFRRYTSQEVKVIFGSNGHEGLSHLNQNPEVDLIILDINMPVMSGLEFLGHVQAADHFRRIPVVIISTEGHEDDILRGLRAGARAYLTKPFAADELYRLVDRIWGEAQIHRRLNQATA